MNYEAIILFLITGLAFYIKIKYGIILLSFWLLSNFFLTTFGMNINLEEMPESEIFYIAKKGNYENFYSNLSTFHTIQKKFNLPSIYKPFGVFYDNPYKNKNKLDKMKSIIGIIMHTDKEKEKEKEKFDDKEFKKYMKEQKFKSITIPKCKGIIGEYESLVSIKNSFIWIAKIYIGNINQKFFTRLYNPEWKDANIKNAKRNYNKKCGVLEIFDHKKMNIFIPIENDKIFNLYYE
jgi:hypothetical protein